MKSLAVIILAAGKGTRMKSTLAKVLHPIAGMPILNYSLNLGRALCPTQMVVVIGSQREAIRQQFSAPDILFVDQEEQLGTGHAVMVTGPAFKDFQGTVLILCADVPLLTKETVEKFLQFHLHCRADLSVLTTKLENPHAYGRVFRGEGGQLQRIVEDKDLQPGEEKIQEINTGIYCIESGLLFSALPSLLDRNAQKEYYLTDLVEKASALGKKVVPYLTEDALEVMGINTRLDLAKANQHLRQKIGERHMLAGVTLLDPQTTYIDYDVKIGQDTTLYPNCYLLGTTSIGEGCAIEPGCKLADAQVGNFVIIKTSSVISESVIEDGVEIGPFAHLRQQNIVRTGSKVGNFVELKKSVIGKGTKANHLSYIGDTTVGEKVNVGAGTITCNYDGHKKHPTIIEDGVFVGSNTALVAPIKIGRNAVIGAGSTITKEVPPETLAVTRAKQVHYKKRTTRKE